MRADDGAEVSSLGQAWRKFESLVLALSASLVGAKASEIDAKVNQALAELRAALGPGRIYIFMFSPDGRRISSTHEALAPGIPSLIAEFQDVDISEFGWSMNRLKRGETVEVRSADALPPEASAIRDKLRELGVTSLVIVPLRGQNGVTGGIGFDWHTQPEVWPSHALPLLRFTGEILAGVLARAQAERALLQVEARFRSFMDSNIEGVFCYELEAPVPIDTPPLVLFDHFLEARLVLCNRVYARPRGSEIPESLYGKRMRELALAPLDRLRELFLLLLHSGNTTDGEETQQVLPDGTVRWARTRAYLVVENNRFIRLWGTLRDITDEKRAAEARALLDAQLRQAQKMESIGLLAGGIAHDFNNLLLVIMNYTQVACADLEKDPTSASEALKQVMAAAGRAAELTRGLLTFSRQQALQRAPLNLNDVIQGILILLRRIIRESVEIDFLPGHALGTIAGDRSQLEQIMVNLCVNAADAIADVGRITIGTENVKLDGDDVRAHPWARAGRYVRLTISDNGEGMSAEVRDRIFEPFFTTKPSGKGTGLGLAIVYGVVKQHEGMIHVHSEPGRGTTFTIYLPIVEREVTSASPTIAEPATGGNETILLAEDHEMVRELARLILERAGYRVLVARDGAEALHLFDKHESEIDLALLDAIMPRVSGHEVYRHIRDRHPTLPVLFASGYTSSVFPANFIAEHEHSFIGKPYDADELLRRVRTALNSARD